VNPPPASFAAARTEPAAPHAPAAPAAPADGIPHAALDAVAAILRALAQAAGAGSQAGGELEAWAQHILVMTPAPCPPAAAGVASVGSPTSARSSRRPTSAGSHAEPGSEQHQTPERDWRGLRHRVVERVRETHETSTRSIGALQETVWLVVERLSHTVAGDAASDADATEQLERLRAAVSGPPEELKATALAAAERLSAILDERSSRQRALAQELGERLDLLRGELEDTRREADIDPLTQVWNRGVLARELPRAVQVRTLLDEPACLAIVDIDGFKQVNDSHGHTVGDLTLELVGATLVRCFPRRSDVVTRLGGDEFAVILPGTDEQVGERLAGRLIDAVRALEVPSHAATVAVTVSVGLAAALPGEQAEQWLARADSALYEAKAAGRDCVRTARIRAPGIR